MVEIARKKFEKTHPDFKNVAFAAQDARWIAAPPSSTLECAVTKPVSAVDTISWKLSKPYFDVVLQTMGLCSTPDPVRLLRHLGTITDPENGRILLLEHGRSHYRWLDEILDNLAAAHANRFGCWWNRDIGRIVEQSGLEVVEIKRWHLGTTWRVILRPKKPHVHEA
jgi:methyltransferase OMS1, mitochondrial